MYKNIIINYQKTNKVHKKYWWLFNIKLSELPYDYLEYIEYFGEGILGNYIRIFPVKMIDQLIKPWREKSVNNPFFKSSIILNQQEIGNSIIIGDTIENSQIIHYNGDYFIYNVEIDEFVLKVGTEFKDVLEWFKRGDFYEPLILDTFTPYDSTKISPLTRLIGNFFYDKIS